jgi:electron transfer flavoprotein beta subunit
MRAKKYEPLAWTAAELPDFDPVQVGLKGSPTRVFRTFTPQRQYKGEILKGEVKETTAALYRKIKDMKIL